ncbi:DUF2478 domain-containing protein [Cereibacter sphaeroides]|uniref:DUF2478 domain-containing protein n=1 Tax=Cereibacter sphaeroides TaxID=1063 RepID=UPI001F410C66|nr:DUF2478 domain-containing protein [Cereibacter sphaeroides]MCE6952341.1 DUF2478 domain-containing protein [Cereibacter sphaeroides]
MHDETERLILAAIPLGAPGVDALLDEVVAVLRAEGLILAGFLQERQPDGEVRIRDLATGGAQGITQRLGPGSRGCKLDPQALAGAAAGALATLGADPDLLVIPRFGKAEAEGHGLRTVIERACERQIPVLVAVRQDSRPAWDDFTGGLAEELPLDRGAVLDWCRTACRRSQKSNLTPCASGSFAE